MKKITIIALACALATSCLSSLEGLDQSPLDKVSESTFFKDASQLETYTNYLYQLTFTGPFCTETNDLLLAKSPGTRMRGGSLRTTPSSGGGWDWNPLARINALLDHLGNCDDQNTRILYEAYGRFFRAYFYYYKVRDFGDVPFYDHELGVSENDQLYKARDSRDYIMEKMLADVDFAIANLPSEKDLYHVTKWTAMAFKSRFCLFEGTWRKYHGNTSLSSGEAYEHDADYYLKLAADVSADFMEHSPYSLVNTGHPEIDYTHVFNQPVCPDQEVILAKSYSITLQVSHFATYDTFGTSSANSFSKKFVDAFLMADGTRFTDKAGWQTMDFVAETKDRDPRLAQSIRTPGYCRFGTDIHMAPNFNHCVTGYSPIKYFRGPAEDGYQMSDCDLILFRAAEVYLNYAEAKAELGTLTQSDIDRSIKPLRDRVGMPNLIMDDANGHPDPYLMAQETGYPKVAQKNSQNVGLILEIRRERTIELLGEGFRYYDIIRWAEGHAFESRLLGMYFPGEGTYDLDEDGTPDVTLYLNTVPSGAASNTFKIGSELILSDGNSGCVDTHRDSRTGWTWNDERDYYYPIPIKERTLTDGALTQNPGWKDGLSF